MNNLPSHLEAQSSFLLLKQFADRLQNVEGPKRELLFADEFKGYWALINATIKTCFDGKTPADLDLNMHEAFEVVRAILEYCILGTNLKEGRSVKPLANGVSDI